MDIRDSEFLRMSNILQQFQIQTIDLSFNRLSSKICPVLIRMVNSSSVGSVNKIVIFVNQLHDFLNQYLLPSHHDD